MKFKREKTVCFKALMLQLLMFFYSGACSCQVLIVCISGPKRHCQALNLFITAGIIHVSLNSRLGIVSLHGS